MAAVQTRNMQVDKHPLLFRSGSKLNCIFLVLLLLLIISCGGSESKKAPAPPPGFTVDWGSPLFGAKDVGLTHSALFHFTEAIDEERLASNQIQFLDLTDNVVVETIHSYDAAFKYLTIDPVNRLLPLHEYRVAIHESIADLQGNTLGTNIYTEFTTAALNPFVVDNVNPGSDLMEVGLDGNIAIKISNYILLESINEETVSLHNLTTNKPVPIEVGPLTIIGNQSTNISSYSGIKINPVFRLSRNSEFEIRVSDGVRDLDKQKLTEFSSRFYTTNSTAIPVPEVISTENTKTQVSTDHQLFIQFSDRLDPASVDPDDRFLRNLDTGRWVSTRAWIDEKRLVIQPLDTLDYSTPYDFGVYGMENSIIRNIHGDVVSARYSWEFLTAGPPDTD